MDKITLTRLQEMKDRNEKIACLTAYDASFSQLLDEQGIDVQLVGDSLGMVIKGMDSTVPVKLDEMVYHTANTRRGMKRGMLIADMPFMSYSRPYQALDNAARLMADGGAQMVKMEGGDWLAETVQLLESRGIPVCAHLGLMPQSIHKIGGYQVQGRTKETAERMLEDAKRLQEAGAAMLLVECIPSRVAKALSQTLSIPVIGIGAGVDCSGQILVLYDMLGISDKKLKFSQDFLAQEGNIRTAIGNYVNAVKAGEFPGPEHSFE